MRRALALIVCVAGSLCAVGVSTPAWSCPPGTVATNTNDNENVISVQTTCWSVSVTTGQVISEWTYHFERACNRTGDSGVTCNEDLSCHRGDQEGAMYTVSRTHNTTGVTEVLGPRCYFPRQQITMQMIANAFREVPLPESKMIVQPPGGKTLINFDTVFHTEAESFETSVPILDRTVFLRISPVSYAWSHGDGTEQTTDYPGQEFVTNGGKAKPSELDGYVTHQYTSPDTFTPSVDTTWTALYRVGQGGTWEPVDGQVTVEGEAVTLTAVEGDLRLVS